MTRIHGDRRRLDGRRRPHPVLIGLAGVLLLAGVLAWMRYDPVVGGELTWCPQPSTLLDAGVEDDADGGEPLLACTTANTDASEVRFAATIHNSGFLPVFVRDVRMRGEIQGVVRIDAIRMAVRNDELDVTSRELVRFAPFRLGPGQVRLVEVAGTLTPCEEVSSARVVMFRSLPLRTTVFGLPHDSDAALTPPVQLIAEGC